MSKEEFKMFARANPSLATKVLNGETTWQKLYEMYDIYGATSNVWDNFLPKQIITTQTEPTTFKEFFNTFKNIDMESVQKGVNNLQKTVGLLQELGIGTKQTNSVPEPKPLYKYFED